jgi:eukaryotic-like serine/threonine-protein kinase
MVAWRQHRQRLFMSEDVARRRPPTATPTTDGGTIGEESPAGSAGSTVPESLATAPRYRLLGPLGIGGMGVVYRAEDTHLGRTVALKFLPPTLTPDPRAKARFLREARAAAALDHPNICTIYEAGETADGQLYLAMACYEGETLRRRLERGPLPVAEALHIALQVARGLAKAHCQGIVHRDIKPSNLMITADGMVKILDFGIAQLPDQTLSGPPLGTPGYMSPEQARGGEVDARSDVWSLGVALWEMLTGRRPGAGELPREAPPGLGGVLLRMLAEEPAGRYPDAAALLVDLSALESAVRPPTPVPVRRRLPAWVVVLVVALAVAAGFRLLRGDRRPGTPDPGPASRPRLVRLTDLPGKEWFPSLSPDGDFLVYAKEVAGRSRLFRQRMGGSPVALLPATPEGDSQPALSPDGRQVAFRSEREGGGIFLVATRGGEAVRRISTFGFNPAWSPDGREILFATEGVDGPQTRRHPSQLYRVHLATGEQRLVHQGDAVQPSWSPRGARIAFWSAFTPNGARVIWTVPAHGGTAVPVTTGESVDWNPVWSPDGRQLYFASDRSGVTNLWRVPIDELSGRVLGAPEPVTTSSQAGLLLSFSRDGGHLVYASDETRTTLEAVAFAPASGALAGPPRAIVQTSNLIATIDASRDGRWLVYQTAVPQEDLFVVRPDGTGLRRLTDDRFKDRQPRWSPDGTRIAFYSNRGGSYEIWTIRADGSGLERAAALPGTRAFHPIWSPDGRWLACDLGQNEALIDLTRPAAERRPRSLPLADLGMGFSASSWSADGRWLSGALHSPDERQVPGVVLYSLAGRSYLRLTDRGKSATWLSDSRHLLYRDGDGFFLLDAVSRMSRHLLTVPPDSRYNDFCLSPDDRVLYLARNDEQGDIWRLALK